MEEKRKITLQIPISLLSKFDEVAKNQLGIGRNSFFALAAVLLLAKTTPILGAKRRSQMIKELGDVLSTIVADSGKAA